MTSMLPRVAVTNTPARGPDRAAARPMRLHALPGHLFRRLHQQAVALYGMHAGDVDLTPVQYAALHAIDAWPDSDQSTIGRAIACDKATLGAVLDRLQAKGFVARIADPQDRRAWRLRATDSGQALLAHLEPRIATVQQALLAPLTDAEAAQLMRLLVKLVGPPPGGGEGP